MINTLNKVIPALERVGIKYVLGDESLLGLVEGDFEKYIFNPVLYVFPRPLNWLRYLALAILLLFQGITLKPKWVHGKLRYKVRRKPGLSKKDRNFIFLLPLKLRGDQFEIRETGRECRFFRQDLLPAKQLINGKISFSVPHHVEQFASRYRSELLSNSYRKHPASFDEQSAALAERMLFQVSEVLNRQGSHWWLEGGTLLGLYRDGKLLDWDHDIDLGVRFESREQVNHLLKDLKKLPYYIKILDFPEKKGLWRLGEIRLIKLFPRRFHFLHTALCLDLFLFYREALEPSGDLVYKYVVHERNGYHPASLLDELDDLTHKGHRLRRPLQTEHFLKSKYGENWATPVKQWHVAIDDKTILNNMKPPKDP